MPYSMADIENLVVGGGDEAVTAEEDSLSGCFIVGCTACLGCTIFGASWGLTTLSALPATTATSAAVQALGVAGFVAGFAGKILGCTCCSLAGKICLRGNLEGTQQPDLPHVRAAVD